MISVTGANIRSPVSEMMRPYADGAARTARSDRCQTVICASTVSALCRKQSTSGAPANARPSAQAVGHCALVRTATGGRNGSRHRNLLWLNQDPKTTTKPS